MNVGKQKRLEKRRLDFYRLWAHGKHLREVVDTIAEAYHAKEGALYKDWERRSEWQQIIPESADRFLVQDALFRLNELRRELWQIIENEGTEVKDRMKTLGILIDMEFRILLANQSFRHINENRAKIVVNNAEIEKIAKIVADVAGPDVNAQQNAMRILLRITGDLTDN